MKSTEIVMFLNLEIEESLAKSWRPRPGAKVAEKAEPLVAKVAKIETMLAELYQAAFSQ